LCPLDRQQAELGADAARRRKPAGFATRRHDAMTRYDDRERILPERLGNVARQMAIAQPLGDLAVGPGATGRDGARDVLNAAIELWHGFVIEGRVA
jgi:hypothetical protein